MDTIAVGATTRLRRTFKYPSDDDDDGSDASHDEMDEEEQERLLADLRASELASNRRYTLVLTGLPLVVVLPFVQYLTISTTTSMAMLCLLSITSLVASAYVMYCIPIGSSDSDSKSDSNSDPDAGAGAGGTDRSPSSIFAPTGSHPYGQRQRQRQGRRRPRPRLPLLTVSDAPTSPVTQYLPTLNAAIGALLCLASMAYRAKPRPDVPEGLWLFLLLPPLVFSMVYVAKRSMRDVQTGLGELQGLRYEYKGA